MLTFLAVVVPTLLLLPAVLLAVMFPGPVTRLWRHLRPVQAAPPETPDPVLVPCSALDRAGRGGPPRAGETCDRCETAAVAAVYLAAGDLRLCGHHGRQYEHVLTLRGAVVVGELSFSVGVPAQSRG